MASMTSTLRGGEDVAASTLSPKRSLSLTNADSSAFSGWKRPWMSQVNFKFWFHEKSTYLYIFILIILNKYLFITVNSPRTLSNFIKYLRPKSWITKEPIGKFDIFIHFNAWTVKKCVFVLKKRSFNFSISRRIPQKQNLFFKKSDFYVSKTKTEIHKKTHIFVKIRMI